MALTEKHARILEARGLDIQTLVAFGVESCDRLGPDTIKIPYRRNHQIVNWKYRTIAGEKRFCQEEGAVKSWFNEDCLRDPMLEGQPVIVTEGELDAFAAFQSGFYRVISAPDGAPTEAQGEKEGAKYSYVRESMALFAKCKEIILAVDGDAAGANLLQDLALRFGRARCKFVRYPRRPDQAPANTVIKDLLDVAYWYSERGVVATLSGARWFKVDGLFRLHQLPDLQYLRPHSVGISEELDRHYKARLGDFCVITGIPGHGKSTFAMNVAANLLWDHGWFPCVAPFEATVQQDLRRDLRTYYSGRMGWGPDNSGLLETAMSEDMKAEADDWINNNWCWVAPDEDVEIHLEWVMERVRAAIIQEHCKTVIIDPWNEMDHERPPGMNLTEYTGFAIKQFRKLFAKYLVHGMIVAHPSKMKKNDSGYYEIPTLYDISDSAHWYNKSQVGIIVHRVPGHSIIRVQKSKVHSQIGTPGDASVRWDQYTSRFYDASGAEAVDTPKRGRKTDQGRLNV